MWAEWLFVRQGLGGQGEAHYLGTCPLSSEAGFAPVGPVSRVEADPGAVVYAAGGEEGEHPWGGLQAGGPARSTPPQAGSQGGAKGPRSRRFQMQGAPPAGASSALLLF